MVRSAPALPGRVLVWQAGTLEAAARAYRRAAARRWGVAELPPAAPPPPRRRPPLRTAPALSRGGTSGLPAVILRVPTADRVVFLTVDDGAEKDPRFVRMMSELAIPYSAFLSHYLVKDDYAYFRRVRRLGNGVHNHTLNHRYLPALSYPAQRAEICGQQRNLLRETGRLPRLFRPPYGEYSRRTLRAAASCGIRTVPLWTQEAFPDRMEYREADRRLHPGDIILSHFRGPADWGGTMTGMVRRVLRTAAAQGFAIARLEDYV
ncbi:polysaccharide deacetylase family protein [Streptomyces sp. MST-110588]|uniref:polysaccharide deacetylase family protein n=1 Tax=Streptomyces sp. MST-110588 TaxID=2833628 RepID=UPI001F5D491E|nr:polysaccharide deacetylase family protein [Streptomyces sp. MST-110588]UNO41390.1 polysaccharide deacetylase family protein [Streptomyces sp. MST-110588]